MDKCFFLIVGDAEILEEDSPSNFIVHELVKPHTNSVVYVMVPDFLSAKQFRKDVSHSTVLILDAEKDPSISQSLIRALPEFDCIIDFTGKLHDKVLNKAEDIKIAKHTTWEKDEMTPSNLGNFLKSNSYPDTVVISIKSDHRRSGIKSVASSLKKQGRKLSQSVKSTVKHERLGEIVIFTPGKKFRESVSSRNARSGGEAQPLLPTQSPGLSSIICCCFPFGKTNVFRSQQHLKSFVRGQYHFELRKELGYVYDRGDTDYKRRMNKVEERVEDVIKSMEPTFKNQRKERIKQWEEVKDRNAENPPKDELYARAAESQEQFAQRKIKWVDQDFRKQKVAISEEFEGERNAEREKNYEQVVLDELAVVKDVQTKFQAKYDLLFQEHFGSRH